MFMPLTDHPVKENVPWGDPGIPNAYPIALNGMGAWEDIVPTADTFRRAATGVREGDPAEIVKVAAVCALLYVGYKIVTGTKRVAGKAARYAGRVPKAFKAMHSEGYKAARAAEKEAWKREMAGE